MSDMPKIPEHAKMRAFHGGYPDAPTAPAAEREGEEREWLEWARRFAVYAFDLDGYDTLTEEQQRICRVAAEWRMGDRAALLAARRENETLRQALIAHRADLHNWSNRPCPTCRQSAKALGIHGKVPYSCALGEKDAAALAATQEPR